MLLCGENADHDFGFPRFFIGGGAEKRRWGFNERICLLRQKMRKRTFYIAFLLTCILSFLLPCACRKADSPDAGITKQILQIPVSDELILHGMAYEPAQPHVATLVLLHRLGADHTVWEPYIRSLCQAGYFVAAIDLRGHGESTQRHDETIHYRNFKTADWLRVKSDLGYLKKALKKEGANLENYFLMGESIGANLAVLSACEDPEVQGLVLLSPGLSYRGVSIEEEFPALKKTPILLITSEGDAYAASSCSTLKKNASNFCELRSYPGAAHGVDIFTTSQHSFLQVLQWLEMLH